MTRPIKTLLALSALLPASLAAALVAILLDVARNAHDAREAAEHRESERRGERDEARSALADSERERLIAAGQLAKERAISDGLSQSLAKHQVALIDACAEVERLTREAARENEQNTADRAAVERLTVDNDGLRGDLKRAERSGLRAAFQLLDVRRDLDACYAIGWEAIVERDAARVKAEQWERSWTSQGWHMEERRKDARDLQRRLDAAITRAEKAEADATQVRTAEQAAYEREAAVGRRAEAAERSLTQRSCELDNCQGALAIANHRIAVLESQVVMLSTRTVTLAGAAPAEPVAAPPVACTWCGGPTPGDRVLLDGEYRLCIKCFDDDSITHGAIRARYAARALQPVAAAPATVEPLTPATLAAALAEGRAMRPALEARLAETAGHATVEQMDAARVASATAASAQDDLDDQAVRELLSRGRATWYEAMDLFADHCAKRSRQSFDRLGAIQANGPRGAWSLPTAPEATEREGGT